MTPVLVFDIETIPDVAGLRKLHELGPELPDGAVATMAFQLRRQATGHDFLPLHLHRVVAIACALSDGDTFKIWSIGGSEGEGEIIQRFFDGIENTRRSSSPGMALGLTCRCCTTAVSYTGCERPVTGIPATMTASSATTTTSAAITCATAM